MEGQEEQEADFAEVATASTEDEARIWARYLEEFGFSVRVEKPATPPWPDRWYFFPRLLSPFFGRSMSVLVPENDRDRAYQLLRTKRFIMD